MGRREHDLGATAVEQFGHLSGDLDHRAGVIVGNRHGACEADGVLLESTGIAEPVGDDASGLSHGEHAMGDDVGQADGLREALIPVDGVEVSGGAGVADEVEPGHPEGLGRQRGADNDVAHDDSSAVPRATMTVVVVTTCSPASVVRSTRVVRMSLPATARMASMVAVATRASPATMGRE